MLIPLFVFSVTLTMANCDLFPNINGNLTKITWDHAVNNKTLLDHALKSNVMMLEADVVLGTKEGPSSQVPIPIMCHPPKNISDLTLEDFLNKTFEYNKGTMKKGIKLDFKSIEAFEQSIPIMDKYYSMKLSYPLWLNADILRGPENNSTVPVDAKRFLDNAKKYPNATLSIGWTTAFNDTYKKSAYNQTHINAMKDVLKTSNINQHVTFPVRAGLAINSVKQFKELLGLNENYSLTIWTGNDDVFDIPKLRDLIVDIGMNKTYVDVPKSIMDKLNLPDGKSSANQMVNFGVFTTFVALSAYLLGNNIFS